MTRFFDYSRLHTSFAIVFFILLLISAVSDVKSRRIPKVCSYGLLLISLLRLIYDRQYVLAAYFALSVLATGSKGLKLLLYIGATAIFANKGEASYPLIFGLAAADLLFTLKIIGGGDAQLLFSMLCPFSTITMLSFEPRRSISSAVNMPAGPAPIIKISFFMSNSVSLSFFSEIWKSETLRRLIFLFITNACEYQYKYRYNIREHIEQLAVFG